MWLRSNDDNIREYFNQVKDQYPNLKYEDIEHCILSAFTFFRKCIESCNFQIIHIKYFGKFIPFRDYEDKQTEKAKRDFKKVLDTNL